MFLFQVADLLGKSVEEVMKFSIVELRGWSAYLQWKHEEVDQNGK